MDMPECLVFNILLRLPVRLLLRLKCVCKDWCVLIDSTLFKDNYLAIRRAKAVDDQLVCLKLKSYEWGIHRSFVTGWYDDYQPLLALSATSNDVFELLSGNTRPGRSFIIGHVNGIVCVKGGNRGDYWEDDVRENWFDIILVNPALRQFRKLPVPDLGGDNYTCHIFNAGFGYDEATNDYKVFVEVTVVDLGYEKIGLVYRLSTDSWRILGNMSDFVFHNHFTRDGVFFLCISGEAAPFAHGSLHFVLSSDPNFRVLAFNLSTESFQEMLFPHGWSYDKNTTSSFLFTIDKSTIALVAFSFASGRRRMGFVEENNIEEQVVDIWVMKEYGDSESWTKLYSITSLPSFRLPLSFWRKQKLLLLKDDFRLICYDLITSQVHEYEIAGSYDLSEGQQEDETPGHLDPICGQPLRWNLQFVSGHESFVSLKQV